MNEVRVRVKICGLTSLIDALAAADAGADALGFVLWPESPRAVSVDRAAAIARDLPPWVTPVGVFVNAPVDAILRAIDAIGLGAVQLHGDERLEVWERIPRPVLKAVGVDARFDPLRLGDWPRQVTPLLDAHDPARRGGTGRPVDWAVAAAAARVRPVVLSGGLGPDNVREAIDRVAPWGVDVSSGVERRPGVKDHGAMRAFVAAVRAADRGW